MSNSAFRIRHPVVFMNLVRRVAGVVSGFGWWVVSRPLAFLSGVEIGKGARFYGRPTFVRSESGSIRIGRDCVFRSSARSNLIGINRPCIFSASSGAKLTVGNGCGFSGTVIGCFLTITIGDQVRFGANTHITDGDWHLDDPRVGPPKPVVIGDNVWLGEGVTVLKGVTIGPNTVIGARSVVTSDIPANVLAAGSPCRVVKPRS